jgi:hypothetical protein
MVTATPCSSRPSDHVEWAPHIRFSAGPKRTTSGMTGCRGVFAARLLVSALETYSLQRADRATR